MTPVSVTHIKTSGIGHGAIAYVLDYGTCPILAVMKTHVSLICYVIPCYVCERIPVCFDVRNMKMQFFTQIQKKKKNLSGCILEAFL